MIRRFRLLLGIIHAVDPQTQISGDGALFQQLLQRLHHEIIVHNMVDMPDASRVRRADDFGPKLPDQFLYRINHGIASVGQVGVDQALVRCVVRGQHRIEKGLGGVEVMVPDHA